MSKPLSIGVKLPESAKPGLRALCSSVALLLIVLSAFWAFRPGLRGGFLFDDLYNLNVLGRFGSVRHLDSLLLYLTSGHADPLGRPLSLLSFLIDANDWPADPQPFKWTNLMLHLLNGILLIWVLLRLGRTIRLPESRAVPAAILGGGLWLLHPLWVSTTLYVVQREAMLPATCLLIAFLLWIEGRERYLSQKRRGVPLLVVAAWPLTLIASLCKANGVLLPLLLLTAEFTVLADVPPASGDRASRFRQLRALLLGVPVAVIAVATLGRLLHFSNVPYDSRGWNDYQHLISEPRVLIDYLHQLLVPRASISGLFNDAYQASTGLHHPATTLPAVLAILALASGAIVWRRKLPLPAFALLFFFGAHLIESSVWPLELYFEHRNYLAAMPLFWPFAVLLFSPPVGRMLAVAASVVLISTLALLTRSRASIWGNPQEQARLMMADPQSDSPRATITAASYEIQSGRAPIAAHWLRQALSRHPDDLPLTLTLIDADCAGGDVPPEDFDQALHAISIDRRNLSASAVWASRAMSYAEGDACHGFDWEAFDRLFDAAHHNAGFSTQPGYRRAYWHARGQAALQRQRIAEALEDFNRALLERRDYDLLLAQMSLLGETGHPDLGLAHLAYFHTLTAPMIPPPGMPTLHVWLLQRLHYWDDGLREVSEQLRRDAAATGGTSPSSAVHASANRPRN